MRRATEADAPVAAELLDAFAREFGDPTPGPAVLAPRLAAVIASGDAVVLLAGDPPAGVALLTFRGSVWTGSPTATLDELYVRPERRARGLGRLLLRAALDAARERGAATVELYTGEGDAAARHLYETHGFHNIEPGQADRLLFYSCELAP